MRPVALVLLAGFATLANACSYAFVDRYHEPPMATVDIRCTSSYTLPIVDTVLTAIATAATVYLATQPADDMPADAPGSAGAAGFTSLFALGTGTSAIYGAWNVHTCRFEKQRAE